jgi:hypothetical protein
LLQSSGRFAILTAIRREPSACPFRVADNEAGVVMFVERPWWSMTTPLKYGSMIDNAVQRVANENDRIINPPTDNVVSLPHSQSRPR